jgi:hypothetical protein
MKIGRRAEKEQVNALGAHLLLDGSQASLIVGHNFLSKDLFRVLLRQRPRFLHIHQMALP